MSTLTKVSLRNSSRSRAFCYTFNNPPVGFEFAFALLATTYHIYGKEIAPTTGTPHLQGYMYFKNAISFVALLKKLPPGIHLEIAKGTADDNMKYCKKEGDYVEFGIPPMSSKEKGQLNIERWTLSRVAAEEGRFDDIPDDIRMKYYNTINRMYADSQIVPTSIDVLDFHWYWGATGTGKSRKAREENPDHFLKNPNKWWDGYKGQACVIIDEWSPVHSVLANHLKQWADHHAFAAEVKGGSKCLRPVKIIVTSNYSIEECFPDAADHLPLKRRFQVLHFTDLK